MSDASEDIPKAKPKKEKSSSKKDKKSKKEKRSTGNSKPKSSKKGKEVPESAPAQEASKKVRIELKRSPKPAKSAATSASSAKLDDEPIGEEVTVRSETGVLLMAHQGTYVTVQASPASSKAAHVEKSEANSQSRALSSCACIFTHLCVAVAPSPTDPLDENIAAPPSLLPAKKYCDVTGLPAPYTDPRTKMRFTNVDVYKVISAMTDERVQQHLAARGATYHTRSAT